MTTRHLATLAATPLSLSLLLACTSAHAQTASTDPTLASPAPTKDQGIVNEPATKATPKHERANLTLVAGMVSAQNVRVYEAGRTYSLRLQSNAAFDIAGCLRVGPACLGYAGRVVAAQRVERIDGLPLRESASMSTIDHAFFTRFELGNRFRFRPSFGIAIGNDRLTLPTVTLEGFRVDARLGLDIAFPIGRHALVLQSGVSMPVTGAALTPRNTSGLAVADVEAKRDVGGFFAFGPEFRL